MYSCELNTIYLRTKLKFLYISRSQQLYPSFIENKKLLFLRTYLTLIANNYRIIKGPFSPDLKKCRFLYASVYCKTPPLELYRCDDRFCPSKHKSGKISVKGIRATSTCEQQGGKLTMQLAWLAKLELVTIPRY